MEDLRQTLNNRYQSEFEKLKSGKRKKRARVQVIADHIFKELGLTDYRLYPSLCRMVKHNKESHIMSAVSWVKDYPNARDKFKLFSWQLAKIRDNSKKD